MYRVIGITDNGKLRLYDIVKQEVTEVTRAEAKGYDILPSYELRALKAHSDKDFYVLRAFKDSYLLVDKRGERRRVTPSDCLKLVSKLNNMYCVGGKLEFFDRTRSNEQLFDIDGDVIHRCDTETPDTVYIPSYIRKIDRKAFKDVKGRYYRMSNVEELESKAFINSNVVLLDFNNKLVEVGEEAFRGCKGLNFVRGISSLRKVASKAFAGCGHLQYFPFNQVEGDIVIEEEAFMGTSITSIKLSNKGASVKIGARAFKQCMMLTDIEIDSESTVEEYAFYRCRGVENISLLNCEVVGRYAFAEIDRLVQVDIPDAVKIHDTAFEDSNYPKEPEAELVL